MISRYISPYTAPEECLLDSSIFVPRLLRGETAQGFLTANYVQRQIKSETWSRRPFNRTYLTKLL